MNISDESWSMMDKRFISSKIQFTPFKCFWSPQISWINFFKTKTTGCGHPLPSHIIKSFKVKLFDNVKFTLCTIAIDRYGLKITKKHWIKMYESMTSNEYNYKSQEMVVWSTQESVHLCSQPVVVQYLYKFFRRLQTLDTAFINLSCGKFIINVIAKKRWCSLVKF